MSAFLETWDGTLIPINEITRIGGAVTNSQGTHRPLSCGNGNSAQVGNHMVEQLLLRPVQLIPAVPGTNWCTAWTIGDDPAEWGIMRSPVIAWALCADGVVRAVTPAGVNDGRTDRFIEVYVEMPDGSIHGDRDQDAPYFRNADAMLDAALERENKARPKPAGVEVRGDD